MRKTIVNFDILCYTEINPKGLAQPERKRESDLDMPWSFGTSFSKGAEDMKITITGRKTNIRDSFKEKVEKKLAKLDRFFDDDARVVVTVTNEQDRETVEVAITADKMFCRAEKIASDRAEALDACVDALFKQITRNKAKLSRRVRAGAIEAPIEDDIADEEEYDLVRVKRFPLRPMDVQEAILQMNMIGHSFYVFRNSENGAINVVYHRADGGYGLIDPEE